MSAHNVDIDCETVQVEGQWLTRDELAAKIRERLDAKDFGIGKLSGALEQLCKSLDSLRTINFRAHPELADALVDAAARSARTPGEIIREALKVHLKSQTREIPVVVPTSARRVTEPEVVAAPSPSPRRETPAPSPAQSGAMIEPESLRSPELAAAAAEMGDVLLRGDKKEDVERRWFND